MNQRPETYTFQRYLSSKRTVDDRALNHHVWSAVHDALAARVNTNPTLQILEVGGGIGTMIERLLEAYRLPHIIYHMLDEQPDNIITAMTRMHNHFQVRESTQANIGTGFHATPQFSTALRASNGNSLDLNLYSVDLFDFLKTAGSLAAVDLMIAHAFLDLLDIPEALPQLTATLRPGALLYFTINFDGVTILEPAIDPAFDAHIEQVYHRTMDERVTNGKISGDSRTGRHLFHQMQTANIQTLHAGSSDWVVIPNQGKYPHDEAYFLHFIIHTMHGALRDHPEIDALRFRAWIDKRHAQIERGELVYIAHQLDYLGEYSGPAYPASIKTSRPST